MYVWVYIVHACMCVHVSVHVPVSVCVFETIKGVLEAKCQVHTMPEGPLCQMVSGLATA